MQIVKQGMHLTCSILILVTVSFKASAQNDADVLRYSMINWGSTARSLAMGSAFGALGADPSVMATNPAGLSSYRRSEFTFSPAFEIRNTDSDFQRVNISESNFKMNIGNMAFVGAFPKNSSSKSDWRSWTFGIGYNRLNDFSADAYAEGKNNKSSLVDSWVSEANGVSADQFEYYYPFDINLGWNGYLFDPDTTIANFYQSGIPGGGARQRQTFESWGGMGEFDISLATNYKDKIFLGGTIGIVSLRYREEVTWEEIDDNNTISSGYSNYDFRSYQYTQSLRTDGSGFNFKFGIVFQPTDYVRIGGAIHSPTFLNLIDDYRTTLSSQFIDTAIGLYSPDFIPFEYDITTPFRAIGSLAFIIGKSGLISAEYEFVDYSNGELSPRDPTFTADFADVNRAMATKYGPSHNFRLGGEMRYEKLRFRLGGAVYGTPFSSGANTTEDTDQSRYSINGGFGIREKHFYFDAGYSYTKSGAFAGVYAVGDEVTGITRTSFDHRLMFTFGFTF